MTTRRAGESELVIDGGCEKERLKQVQDLPATGADVNAAYGDGDTALIWGSKGGHWEVVKLLLEKGVDVNATSILEETASMSFAWAFKA